MNAPPRPVLIALSIAVAIKALLASAAIVDLIGVQVAGVILAVLLAFDVGVAFYLQGRTVPLEDTVVYERAGKLRAGGASRITTGNLVPLPAEVGDVAGIYQRPRGPIRSPERPPFHNT
jgi:hypothetical protein